MNDDEFLTQFHKAPPREFSAALYQRINSPMTTHRTFRRWMFAAALGLALVAALAFSPTARAALLTLMREIGGVTYVGPDESEPPQPAQDAVSTVPEDHLSLDEARASLPYEVSLPAWVPDGYTMAPSVVVTHMPGARKFLSITWWKSQEVGGDVPIVLMLGPRVNWQVDLDHLTEVQVNGEPAGLTGGGWDADTGQWKTDQQDLTLTWMHGDVMYQLRSPGASVEELIRMAESIP